MVMMIMMITMVKVDTSDQCGMVTKNDDHDDCFRRMTIMIIVMTMVMMYGHDDYDDNHGQGGHQ